MLQSMQYISHYKGLIDNSTYLFSLQDLSIGIPPSPLQRSQVSAMPLSTFSPIKGPRKNRQSIAFFIVTVLRSRLAFSLCVNVIGRTHGLAFFAASNDQLRSRRGKMICFQLSLFIQLAKEYIFSSRMTGCTPTFTKRMLIFLTLFNTCHCLRSGLICQKSQWNVVLHTNIIYTSYK